jgi:hypothetical protein
VKGDKVKKITIYVFGFLSSLALVSIWWVFSADCPPNRLIFTAFSQEKTPVEIFVGEQLIWRGDTNQKGVINFESPDQESSFSIKFGDSVYGGIGYVDNVGSVDHILLVDQEGFKYSFVVKGFFQVVRGYASCSIM